MPIHFFIDKHIHMILKDDDGLEKKLSFSF